MRKYLVAVCILFSIVGCKSESPLKHKTENVQACLDLLLLHQKKWYEYLEHKQLILVKDKYTFDLNVLHYGANKIILKFVEPSKIPIHWSEKQDTLRIYITIKYKVVNNDSIDVDMGLPNANEAVKFSLVKKDTVWQPKITALIQY